jgi:hypothetical protein
MGKPVLQDELDRIEIMSTIEAVAYANRLSRNLKSDDCTSDETINCLRLLERLSDIAYLMKIT